MFLSKWSFVTDLFVCMLFTAMSTDVLRVFVLPTFLPAHLNMWLILSLKMTAVPFLFLATC